MARKEKKEEIRNLFFSLTRKESKYEIQCKKRVLGRDLTKEEKHEIIVKNAKQLRKELKRKFIMAGFFLSGGIVGIGGSNLLNAAQATKGLSTNKTEINIDASETTKEINIDNLSPNSRDLFANGYKVDLNEVSFNEDLYNECLNEINNLESPEDIKNYLKNMYLSKYNTHGENLSFENVTLESTNLANLTLDKAQNGDKIFRTNFSRNGDDVMITATIKKDDTIIQKESGAYDLTTGKYISVYPLDKEVDSNKEPLYGMGPLLFAGIHYSSAIENGNSSKSIDEHKKNFINELVSYKQSEINQIMNRNNTQEKNTSEFEIGE